MALKPLFPRQPLVDLPNIPLPLRSVALRGDIPARMRAACAALLSGTHTPYTLLACTMSAYLTDDKDLIVSCSHALDKSGLYMPDTAAIPDLLYLCRAQLLRYEASGDKLLLAPVMQCVKRISNNRDTLIADCTGDILEILIMLYNLTGKKQLLALYDTIRAESFDWAAIRHAYPAAKPIPHNSYIIKTHRIYGHDTKTETDGLSLAYRLRVPSLSYLISGHAKEQEAALACYNRLMKRHGLPGGILSLNPHLGGRSLRYGADTRIAGEIAYSLSKAALFDPAAKDALEQLTLNALVKSISYQGVKTTYYHDNRTPYTPFITAPEHTAAILIGLTAYAQCVYTLSKHDEIGIDFFADSGCAINLNNAALRIQQTSEKDCLHIAITAKKASGGTFYVRIPYWVAENHATLDDHPLLPENGVYRAPLPLTGECVMRIYYQPRDGVMIGYSGITYRMIGPMLYNNSHHEV